MILEKRLTTARVDRVWTLVSDLERWDRMLPTIQHITPLSADSPIGVGARFEVRQPGLPKAVYEISEWEPGAGFTWVSASPGIRTTASHRLTAQDGGTQLVLGLDWSGPLAGVARVLLGSKAARMVEQEADAFVDVAEHDGRHD